MQLQTKSLLVHRTVGTMLPYLNYHAYIVFVVVFNLVGRVVAHGSDLLVCLQPLVGCCWLLLLLLLSDNQRQPCTRVEEAGSLPLGWFTGRDGQLFQAYVSTCLSRIGDVRMLYQCTGLPITTTTAGKWLNSLISYDNIKCINVIIANGQTVINVDADNTHNNYVM